MKRRWHTWAGSFTVQQVSPDFEEQIARLSADALANALDAYGRHFNRELMLRGVPKEERVEALALMTVEWRDGVISVDPGVRVTMLMRLYRFDMFPAPPV